MYILVCIVNCVELIILVIFVGGGYIFDFFVFWLCYIFGNDYSKLDIV